VVPFSTDRLQLRKRLSIIGNEFGGVWASDHFGLAADLAVPAVVKS
jgi:hypothetical protein